MRKSVPTPTADPLPYTQRDEPVGSADSRTSLPLRSEAIARFDALLHEINPDAVRVDPDRLQHLMQWLLALPHEAANDVLGRRLRRIEQLRAMLHDADWDTNVAMGARLGKLLDYIDRGDDLIEDQETMVGLLDDVLLLELAWPVFAAEAEDYRDFCAYREDERPIGSSDEQRHAWVRDRLAEIALLRHQLRIGDSHYAQPGPPGAMFRVS